MKEQTDLRQRAARPVHNRGCAAAASRAQRKAGAARWWERALLRNGEEGSALVEIALVMPMLLAVVTSIFAFGVGFNNQLTLTSAVGSGAQQLQLIRTTTTDPCADTLTAIKNAAPSLTGNSISLSFNFNGTEVDNTNSCAGDQTYLVSGQPVTVTAKYPCVLSIMPMGYGTKFVSNCQLSAKVTEYEY
jgi:Flp pilus assembly protein TadG